MSKKHIVILGAGFGGIYTYKSLPNFILKNCTITLVDKRNHFLFTPLLPEVATGSIDQHNVVEPIRDIISPSINFIQSEVLSVDIENQHIQLADGELDYDILVTSLGSKTHFFGVPGALENSYVLKTLEDSVRIRNRFIDIFEQASRATDPIERKRLLSFIIVGGGPTGVELAGEAADYFFGTLNRQHSDISADEITLTLINSGPSLVRMFKKRMQEYAKESLVDNNVIVQNSALVSEIDENGVILKGGTRVDANMVIWAAGVTANSLDCTIDVFDIERGKICINEFLQARHTKNIFAIGDMSLFPSDDGRGLPMTAQVAKQQGVAAAKNIARMILKKPLVPFVYQEKGILVSLGYFDAIAQINGVGLRGVVAWFMWRTIYLFNFASWRKRFKIMLDWTISLFTRRDTTRL